MEITFRDIKGLKKAITHFKRLTGSCSLPILTHLKIVATGREVFVEGTDHNILLRFTPFDASVHAEGEALVEAQFFAQVIGKAKGPIVLKAAEHTCTLETGSKTYTSPQAPLVEGFPEVSNGYTEFQSLNPHVLGVMGNAKVFASKDESMPNLCSVCLGSKFVSSTDGQRAYYYTFEGQPVHVLDHDVMITRGMLDTVEKILDPSSPIEIAATAPYQYAVRQGEWWVESVTGDLGPMPDIYQFVAGANPSATLATTKAVVLDAIDASQVVWDNANRVYLKSVNGTASLDATNPSGATFTMPIGECVEAFRCSLNGKHVEDAARVITDHDLLIDICNNQPTLLRSPNNPHAWAIISPLR